MLFAQAGRRQFYVNCRHAAPESVAIWKIYGAPGAGVAIVSNGARLENALSENRTRLHLGAVHYVEPDVFVIGILAKFGTRVDLSLERHCSKDRSSRRIHS